MFGERCTLCGGKLDSRKRCKECGLDNSRSEKHYKINKSACDGMPMTHVHGDREEAEPKKRQDPARAEKKQTAPETYRRAETAPKQYRQAETAPKQYRQAETAQETYRHVDTSPKTYRRTDAGQESPRRKEKDPWQGGSAARPADQKKKGGWISKLVIAFIVFSIAGTIIGSLAEMDFDGDLFSDSDDTYNRPDPYETLSESGITLPEEENYEEFELPTGKYIVGVHLPAGYYSADVMNDYDAVRVTDDDHSIFLYEYPAQEEGNYLDDLRLFDGALVEIQADEPVILRTENAQEITGGMDNPLKKEYEFSGDIEKTAGVDFEAGIYDLSVTEGYGTMEIKVSPGGPDLSYGFTGGMEYRNMVIPKGARLILEDDSGEAEESFRISLTPSPWIMSEDYSQIYEDYYRY